MALFLAGLGLGLFLAAQVGPVTLLIVRSVLRGGRALLVGLAMAVAVALVDVVYAALGLFGVAQLFGGGTVRLAFGLASGPDPTEHHLRPRASARAVPAPN